MNSQYANAQSKRLRAPRIRTQWWAGPVACLATLLALPVNAAVVLPDQPLTTGNKVAPNVLFILDDSGSMAFNYMPDTVPNTSTPDVSDLAYTRNTLSYNPAVTYESWTKADGNRMPNASYDRAYGSFNLVGGTTINLGSAASCKRFNYNNNSTTDEPTSGGTNVCGGVQTFHVPKDTEETGASYLADGKNYYRYQILSGGSDILRGEYGSVSASSLNVSPANGSLGNGSAASSATANVALGRSLEITINNTTGGTNTAGLNYTVTSPLNDEECSGSVARGRTDTCTVFPTVAGAYRITVARANNRTTSYSFTARTSNSCDGSFSGSGWANCVSQLPSARSRAQELVNYANWFSYHRTRIKAAKAGASEAFKPLGNKVRVGFRTIWLRDVYPNSKTSSTRPIPVQDGNDGRFVNNIADVSAGTIATTTRNDWYDALQGVIGYNGTPLHGALYQAGEYYKGTADSGAYGPQADVSQYSCRQNFTILTTDGYWNSKSENYSPVNEQDNAVGSRIDGLNGKTYTYNASSDMKWPYASSDSDTLADVAMRYWKTDLRTNLTNNVPTTDDDPGFWQHMVTFGISIGLSGTRGWSSVEDVKNATTNRSWPTPSNDSPNNIDDLLHAAVNGHGQFVAASSPQAFSAGLSKALAAISQRTSSFSNVATNSTSLNTGAKVFSASYTSGTWVGALKAYPVSRAGVSTTASWTASTLAFSTRQNRVFTYNGTSGAAFPTTAQRNLLDRSSVGPVDYPVTGAKNADYIMGDQSGEGAATGKLRIRSTVLGDIVNSSPAYVQDTDTVYVGANDGMLHAFDAEDGRELFGYVPGIVDFTKLAKISRGDYDHAFFVDGPVVVTSKATWNSNKNVLVGSLGRGGKGLYALDVTTPGAFGASSVMWEKNDGNLGNVMGAPILAQVRGSSNGAVIAGNGPNSTTDRAFLIVRNLANGGVIREIPTDATIGNGLSAPIGVYAADGVTVVYAYAGDMQGNVWKFDMTNASPSAWTATKIFHAEKTAGTPQPITSGLAVAVDPATRKRWIFFGTGSYLTTADADDRAASAQSMYGFVDDGGSYNRTNLTPRSVTVSGNYRYFDSKAALPSTSKGWYLDLPGTGERIVQNAQINGTFLVTASMMPDGDACEGSGSGFINAIDAFTGTSGGNSMFDLDNDGTTDNTDAGGNPIGSANLGVGMPTLPLLLPGQVVLGGSGDGSAAGLGGGKTFGMSWQRVSWREIRKDD